MGASTSDVLFRRLGSGWAGPCTEQEQGGRGGGGVEGGSPPTQLVVYTTHQTVSQHLLESGPILTMSGQIFIAAMLQWTHSVLGT